MSTRFVRLIVTASLLAGLHTAGGPGSASAGPAWAPASTAAIRPGVTVGGEKGNCTSNFVFFEPVGSAFDVFIGTAAHCFSLGGPTDINGCTTPSRALGTSSTISGATRPGSLAYSSWIAMKVAGEYDQTTCQNNDLALIKIDPADLVRVNPSVRYFGGPVSLRNTFTVPGEKVVSYGNSSLRLGLAPVSPKRGVSVGSTGWSHIVYMVSPAIPGDSGSTVMDAQGNAFGVFVTLNTAPYVGSNGVTDLSRALAYANAKTGRNIQLALGTEPFLDRIAP